MANNEIKVTYEEVSGFTVMGLTTRILNRSGDREAEEGVRNTFFEEAAHHSIDTRTVYCVIAEPTSVVNAPDLSKVNFSFFYTFGVAVEELAEAPFIFCLKRVPTATYARVTLTGMANTGLAYQALNDKPRQNGHTPNWGLSFERYGPEYDFADRETSTRNIYLLLR